MRKASIRFASICAVSSAAPWERGSRANQASVQRDARRTIASSSTGAESATIRKRTTIEAPALAGYSIMTMLQVVAVCLGGVQGFANPSWSSPTRAKRV